MKVTKRQYTDKFEQQILEECRQIGNASLIARRHQISKNTIHGWMRADRKRGSTEPLPRDEQKRLKEVEKRLGKLSQENDQLKRLVAEKDLPYGYRKLTICLNEDYGLRINHKKVYRLVRNSGYCVPSVH